MSLKGAISGSGIMAGLDNLDFLFIGWAFFLQIVLVIHFALRKWRFETSIRYGPLVYALGVPSAVVSMVLLIGGKSYALWLGGFLYLFWAAFGYTVDYLRPVEWRVPFHWPVAIPYIVLYLTTIMFYWWPLGLFGRPLWLAYTVLVVVSTWLNLSSHKNLESA
jgi:hypothetical protein